VTVYFSQGSAHTKPPTLEDVLDCIASDANGFEDENDFETWCSNYGYDTDSRKAEKTFKFIERQATQLKAKLGNDLYERLIWETERL
jgi:hypothetical protein